jgi:hypothetical protein
MNEFPMVSLDTLWEAASISSKQEPDDDSESTEQNSPHKEGDPTDEHPKDRGTTNTRRVPPLEIILTGTVDGTRRRVENYRTYRDDLPIAAYFVVYSILVAILLAGIAIFTDAIQLMLSVAVIYGLTVVPFFVWFGEAVEDEGTVDGPRQ